MSVDRSSPKEHGRSRSGIHHKKQSARKRRRLSGLGQTCGNGRAACGQGLACNCQVQASGRRLFGAPKAAPCVCYHAPPLPEPPSPSLPPSSPPPAVITHYGQSANSAWTGTWTSAQTFCQNNGHQDLCRYSTICPNGRTNPPIFGQLSSDQWTPVRGDVGATYATNFLQVGTRTVPRDNCCLMGDAANCHSYTGPNFWGASRHSYMNDLYCCDFDP